MRNPPSILLFGTLGAVIGFFLGAVELPSFDGIYAFFALLRLTTFVGGGFVVGCVIGLIVFVVTWPRERVKEEDDKVNYLEILTSLRKAREKIQTDKET